MNCAPCQPPSCRPLNFCPPENFGGLFPSLVGPQGPPGGPGTFVETFTALRLLDASTFTEGYIAYVGGYGSVGDGGGGNFQYNSTSTATDNDGTILEPANSIGRWYRIYSGALSWKWFGAQGNGIHPDAANIQAAIDAAFVIGARTYGPAGTYLTDTTLIFKNGVSVSGDGKESSLTKGTIIKYTGASDAVQVNNPINSSTAANITVSDLTIWCTVKTAGKAAFADTGSTFIHFYRVLFYGNDHGLIMDQTEISRCVNCEFNLAAAATAGVWLVNGGRVPGTNNKWFTNGNDFIGCQFNGPATTGIGIIDDGGDGRDIIDCNFNALDKHYRVTEAYAVRFSNRCEVPKTCSVELAATNYAGAATSQSTTISIESCYFSTNSATPIYFVRLANGALTDLAAKNNHFNNAPTGTGAFWVGAQYRIVTVGTTDFTLIGAASNTVGLVFVATGAGAGTGTAVHLEGFYNLTTTSATKFRGSNNIQVGNGFPVPMPNANNDGTGYGIIYNAADYTAGAGSWTVAAGDVTQMRYSMNGDLMTVFFQLVTTSVSVADPRLSFKIPQGKTAKGISWNSVLVNNNGGFTLQVGHAETADGGTTIDFYNDYTAGTNWAVSANGTAIKGQLTFEVV